MGGTQNHQKEALAAIRLSHMPIFRGPQTAPGQILSPAIVTTYNGSLPEMATFHPRLMLSSQ